jgi:hypothetical protein
MFSILRRDARKRHELRMLPVAQFGAAAGASQVNNVGDLKSVSVQTTESGTVSVVQSETAYLGDYATAWKVPTDCEVRPSSFCEETNDF